MLPHLQEIRAPLAHASALHRPCPCYPPSLDAARPHALRYALQSLPTIATTQPRLTAPPATAAESRQSTSARPRADGRVPRLGAPASIGSRRRRLAVSGTETARTNTPPARPATGSSRLQAASIRASKPPHISDQAPARAAGGILPRLISALRISRCALAIPSRSHGLTVTATSSASPASRLGTADASTAHSTEGACRCACFASSRGAIPSLSLTCR